MADTYCKGSEQVATGPFISDTFTPMHQRCPECGVNTRVHYRANKYGHVLALHAAPTPPPTVGVPNRFYTVGVMLSVTISEADLKDCYERGQSLPEVLADTIKHSVENDTEVKFLELIGSAQ